MPVAASRRRPYSTPDGADQDKLGALIEQFEDQVRKRPLPPAEAPQSTPAAQAQEEPVEGASMPKAVLQELKTELEAVAAEPAPLPAVDIPVPVTEQAGAPAAVEDLETWWSRGEHVEVDLHGAKWRIFTRVLGDGPWMTLIHGFPTSSWDWAPLAPVLGTKYKFLTFDLLGFGDSDKPAGHDWSAFEQADIIEALWKHFGVSSTRVVAHDVGMTVALELMARKQEAKLATRIADFTLLNGGVYAGFHRPRPIQVWLQRPVVGALIARALNEARFGPAFAEIFSKAHQPSAAELHQHWLTVARRNGSRNYHRLIKYIPERRANAARWEDAVQSTTTPIKFIWGMADPVSGAHMAAVIKQRRPGANIVELADIGHYPQLEVPDRVAQEILAGVQ